MCSSDLSLAIPRGDDDGIDALPEDEVPTTIPIGRVPPWLAGRPRGGGSSDAATAAGIAPDVAATGPAPEVRTVTPARPRIPGERYYRDGDRVRHARFGDGIVVTSRLTRHDEEVTVAFAGHGVKTLLGSIAGLEVL